MQLITWFIDQLPIQLLKPAFPRRFAIYGHLVGGPGVLINQRYRYPSLQDFEHFLKIFRGWGYEFVSFKDYIIEDQRQKILITFDDGFENISSVVAPFLISKGIPFLVAVVGRALESSDFVLPNVQLHQTKGFMSFEDLTKLKSKGVEISFHSYEHERILSEGDIESAVRKVDRVIGLLPEIKIFTYPYAAPDDFCAVDARLQNHGFEYFLDTKGMLDPVGKHYFRVPIDVWPDTNVTNPIVYQLKRAALGRLKRRLQRSCGSSPFSR